jgi:primosomal protein N'
MSVDRAVASVRFLWSDKTYDYFIPTGLEVDVGQKVIVQSRNGEAEVEVVEIKAESDLAEKSILRIAEAKKENAEADDDGV